MHGASYHMKGKIFRACVLSVLTYATETWAIKAECRMVRWMCGVSLKDRKRSEVLYSLLGIQSVAKVVRRDRLRWFGHLERKSGDDWVLGCRNVEVVGEMSKGRGRKTWREYVNDDMEVLGFQRVFKDMWRGFISGQRSDHS